MGMGRFNAFVRTDIPAKRQKDLEMRETESIFYDVNINGTKWGLICVYMPPSQSNEVFSQEISKSLDRCSTLCNNDILLGDLNYDMPLEPNPDPSYT